MTPGQQLAKRRLKEAQEKYLFEMGWKLDGRQWIHPQVFNGTRPVNLKDALNLTEAQPSLGWSVRNTG